MSAVASVASGSIYLVVWLGAAVFLFAITVITGREGPDSARIFDLSGLALYTQVLSALIVFAVALCIVPPETVISPHATQTDVIHALQKTSGIVRGSATGLFLAAVQQVSRLWWMLLVALAYRAIVPMTRLKTAFCAAGLYFVFFGAQSVVNRYL
jgi:hypothetical protein